MEDNPADESRIRSIEKESRREGKGCPAYISSWAFGREGACSAVAWAGPCPLCRRRCLQRPAPGCAARGMDECPPAACIAVHPRCPPLAPALCTVPCAHPHPHTPLSVPGQAAGCERQGPHAAPARRQPAGPAGAARRHRVARPGGGGGVRGAGGSHPAGRRGPGDWGRGVDVQTACAGLLFFTSPRPATDTGRSSRSCASSALWAPAKRPLAPHMPAPPAPADGGPAACTTRRPELQIRSPKP